MELAPCLYPQEKSKGSQRPGGAELSGKVIPASVCDDNAFVLELEHWILTLTKADQAGRAEGKVLPLLR